MRLYIIIASILFLQFGWAQETTESTTKVWSLQEAINYAVENNLTVKNAELNSDLAEVDYEASNSLRYPNLYGSVSSNLSNGSVIDPITSNYTNDQIYSNNIGLNSSVTLFQGYQINNQIEQNQLLFEKSIYETEAEKNNIILSVLENYLQALFSKENIVIAENNLAVSEKEVLRAQARLDAGSIAINELTEAKSQAATNRYNVIVAKNQYQQYIIQLKQLLELPPNEEMEIETLNDEINLINLELSSIDIYNNALNVLPEVKSSELNLQVSEKDLEIAKGAYWPTLSLTASIGTGYTSINDDSFMDQYDVNFNQRIGLSLNIPIFNRNQTKAAVQSAEINIEKAAIEQELIKKDIYQRIETAYENAISAQEQVIAAEASQEAAKQSYNLAQKKYELGALSTTDLVISQNTYTNAQQNYLQAKYMSILYHQLLQFYQGNNIQL
ncbi:MAG: TolC family protein [Weeksellaceae bacterium]